MRGCTKISPGCAHCYAETFAERFRGVPGHPYERGFDLRLVPEKLAEPLKLRSSKMIFVNSMSDLFHDGIPDEYICEVAGIMMKANWHTYQVLTKRSERMASLLHTKLQFATQSASHLVGRQCREPRRWSSPDQPSAFGARGNPLSVC